MLTLKKNRRDPEIYNLPAAINSVICNIGVILFTLIVGAVIRRGSSLSYAPIPTGNYLSECMQMNVSIFLIDAFYVVFQFLGVVI